LLSENLCVGLVVLLAAAGCTQNFDDFRGNGGSGGAGVGGLGGGGGAPCDCDDDNICTQDLCDPDGGCLHPAAQVVTVPQVSGDCKNAICDGTMLAQEADARDVPIDDGNDCTTDECDGDMPVHPFVAPGATCNTDGVCDAMGQCSDCDDPGDCGTDTVCATYACTKNACVTTYLAPLVVSGEDDNDCKAMQCVDLEPEPQLLPFLADTEIDTNPCTTDTCSVAGEIEHASVGAGMPCDDGIHCNGVDVCDAGTTCIHPGDPCAGGATCNNFCNEVAETCFNNTATACGSPADTACSNPDTCNGAGACSPNNEAVGFLCGDMMNTTCTNPDTCDASQVCLPNHAASGATCGSATSTACNAPDTCLNGACAANNAAAGTPCPDGTFCNGVDTCNNAGGCISPGNPCPGHNMPSNCNDSCTETAGGSCTGLDVAGTVCNEDADATNGTCTGLVAEPNCAGD